MLAAAVVLGFPALTMFSPFYEDPSKWAALYRDFFKVDFALVFNLSWLFDIQVGSSGCEQGWRRTPTNAADPCSSPFHPFDSFNVSTSLALDT